MRKLFFIISLLGLAASSFVAGYATKDYMGELPTDFSVEFIDTEELDATNPRDKGLLDIIEGFEKTGA